MCKLKLNLTSHCGQLRDSNSSLCPQLLRSSQHLTISYVNPREQTFKKRRSYFLTQHFFDIDVEISTGSTANLALVRKFDSLTEDGIEEVQEEVIEGVEKSLEAFEPLLAEVIEARKQIDQLSSQNTDEAQKAYATKVRHAALYIRLRDFNT